MAASSLPLWVQYVWALGIPIVGALIASVGAAIAYQQMWIAREKLQHDLFDRRHKVFLAARDFLREIFTRADYSDEAHHAFGMGILDAPFMFEQDVTDYLKEIGRRALAMKLAKLSMEDPGRHDHKSHVATYYEHLTWLLEQFTPLMEKFKPTIGFKPAPQLRIPRSLSPVVVAFIVNYLVAGYVLVSCRVTLA